MSYAKLNAESILGKKVHSKIEMKQCTHSSR